MTIEGYFLIGCYFLALGMTIRYIHRQEWRKAIVFLVGANITALLGIFMWW